MSTEDKQTYEELAGPDQERFKKEMKEYEENYLNKFKKTDENSKQFIEKIKSLQSEENKESDDMYLSIAEQTI